MLTTTLPPSGSAEGISSAANRANILVLLAAWAFFLAWFLLATRYAWGLLLAPVAALAFQQHVSGVIHEAAHGLFYHGNARMNNFLAQWLATYLFGYSLDAYRKEHFRHHTQPLYLTEADGETAEYRAGSKSEIWLGFLKDLFFVTSFKMVCFRLKHIFSQPEKVAGTTAGEVVLHKILIYNLVLWTVLSLVGSVWGVAIFWLTFFTLYPVSNRIRVYGTHADVSKPNGAMDSRVAANVMSPFLERIFVGNRLLMYHFEHHLKPGLPFREIEKIARRRLAAAQGRWNYRENVPSYFFSVKRLLFPKLSS